MIRFCILFVALGSAAVLTHVVERVPNALRASEPAAIDRSPVDLVLTADGKHLLTANQSSASVSLIRIADAAVIAEVPCGDRPSAIILTPDNKRVLVTGTFGGDLTVLALDGERLIKLGAVRLGFEPRGVATDGKVAYVALTTAGTVAVVDLATLQVSAQIEVGRWPRYLALSPDASRLAVGVNGDGGIAVVDTVSRRKLWSEEFVGLNLGQMEISPDSKYVYFPWMVYRQRPITQNNIREGWVMASRIARVRLDEPARREAISLDPQGKAVSDPHGFALSPDGQWIYCAASGTHELLAYRLPGLPFQDYGGPGDHIDKSLLADGERFVRIPLGGRPMAIRVDAAGKLVYIANSLLNCVQVVDPGQRKVIRTIALGGAAEPSLARRGEAIFYDGQRSFDQWYSCHSCHYEGHTNAVTMDTRNDGRFGNYKVVLSLRNSTRTGPWTWHGWQTDLNQAMRKSLSDSMLGREPSAEDVKALVAYLDTLSPPPNPYRAADNSLTAEAKRGEAVFRGEKAGCARCHSGDSFTDGKNHEVGTGERNDAYKGYNTPSLIGCYDRPMYLHDGRSKTLVDLLKGPHSPDVIQGKGELTAPELADLIAYLKSL